MTTHTHRMHLPPSTTLLPPQLLGAFPAAHPPPSSFASPGAPRRKLQSAQTCGLRLQASGRQSAIQPKEEPSCQWSSCIRRDLELYFRFLPTRITSYLNIISCTINLRYIKKRDLATGFQVVTTEDGHPPGPPWAGPQRHRQVTRTCKVYTARSAPTQHPVTPSQPCPHHPQP